MYVTVQPGLVKPFQCVSIDLAPSAVGVLGLILKTVPFSAGLPRELGAAYECFTHLRSSEGSEEDINIKTKIQ